MAFFWLSVASAQVPVQGPTPPAEGPPPSEVPPAALPGPPPAPAPPSAAPAQPATSPPPLHPPPSEPPSTGPSFLKRPDDEQSRRERSEPAGSEPARQRKDVLPNDFVLGATPWVDFSLTNFWMDERASNFLNLGVQVGGYFLQRMRITARLVAPLEEPEDDYQDYGYSSSSPFSYENGRSRSIAMLYGASFGLIISNSKSFVFGPGLLIMRTDVNDYGTTASLALPFEWTTARHLRIGFEMAIGHAFGGEASDGAGGRIDRPGGTAIFLQFQMGWAMGHL